MPRTTSGWRGCNSCSTGGGWGRRARRRPMRARGAAGNPRRWGAGAVAVPQGDATPPAVAITAPVPGATVSRTVTVTASATDNVGVAGVQFLLDGGVLGAEDTTAPYAVAWDT